MSHADLLDADRLLDAYLRGLVAFEPWAKRLALVTWAAFAAYATAGILETMMVGAIAVVLSAIGAALFVFGVYASLVVIHNASVGGDDHEQGNELGMISSKPGAGGTSA